MRDGDDIDASMWKEMLLALLSIRAQVLVKQ